MYIFVLYRRLTFIRLLNITYLIDIVLILGKQSDADEYQNQMSHPFIINNYDRLMNDPDFNF